MKHEKILFYRSFLLVCYQINLGYFKKMATLETVEYALQITLGLQGKTPTAPMIDGWHQVFVDTSDEVFYGVWAELTASGKLPSVVAARAAIAGYSLEDDWRSIMAVASGSQASATISGFSHQALLNVGGLHQLKDLTSEQSIFLHRRWVEENKPSGGAAIAPAAVVISLRTHKVCDGEVIELDVTGEHRANAIVSNLRKWAAKDADAFVNPIRAIEYARNLPTKHWREFVIAEAEKLQPGASQLARTKITMKIGAYSI